MKLFLIFIFFLSPLSIAQNWVDFSIHSVRNTQAHGQRIIPVDIDKDGDMDLVTSYSLTDEVVLEINMGNDNWQMIQVGDNIVAVYAAAADFDGDGDLDIVAAGLFDRKTGFNTKGLVIWYEQDGSINNWIPHNIDTDIVHPRYLDVADIDNDGDMDFALISNGQDSQSQEFGNAAVWYENLSPSSNWTRWTIAEGLSRPESVRIGNIDNDMTSDILISEYDGDRVLWFASENNPRRNNWSMHTITSNFTAPHSARLYDMDNDNDLDVVAVFDSSDAIVWFEHPQTLSNSEWNSTVINNEVNNLVEFTRGDFNNDGMQDFALGSNSNGYLAVLEKQGNSNNYTVHNYPYPSFTSVESTDIDGDGDQDLITASYAENKMDWWENHHVILDNIFLNGFEN